MALSTVFSLAGWSYLPDFATRQLLSLVYTQTNLLPRPSGKHSPLYALHYRWAFAIVVFAYLSYNLIQSSLTVQPNFYEILGVSSDVDENGLKVAFRHFAKRYHPDRVGKEGAETFMVVRKAFDALKDPAVRFAYDRFGPDVLMWAHLSTPREYLQHGLTRSSGYHLVSFLALLFFSAIGRPSPVTFWRYLLYVAFMVAEASLLLSASVSPELILLEYIFPTRVAYQHILFLHQLFIFTSIALSRVAPVLLPPPPPDRVSALASTLDREASLLLQTELRSIHPSSLLPPQDDSAVNELAREMENMIIETNLRREGGPLRSAWEAAVARGAASAPTSTSMSIQLPTTYLHVPQTVRTPGTLPSPRPSPPPPYMRGRSVSC